MEIQLSKDLQASVKTQHFAMINIWRLSEKLSVTPGLSGVDLNTANPKTYAAVNCSARVSRLSTFYAANIVMPTAILSGIAIFCTRAVSRQDVADRLAATLTVVLTMAAYKLTIASMMPTIAYLTLLDEYIITCSLFVILVVLQNGLAGMDELWADAEAFDTTSTRVLFWIWAGAHAFFGLRSLYYWKERRNLHTEHESQDSSLLAMVSRPLANLGRAGSGTQVLPVFGQHSSGVSTP